MRLVPWTATPPRMLTSRTPFSNRARMLSQPAEYLVEQAVHLALRVVEPAPTERTHDNYLLRSLSVSILTPARLAINPA